MSNEFGTMTQEQITETYNKEFMPGMYRWGIFTDILGAALSFGPAIVLAVVYDLMPSISLIISASVARALTGLFINWFVEPFAFYPIMGLPGLFMTMLSGNTSNLRLPALVAAQQGAGVEQGNIISIIGIAVSVVISTIFIAIAAFGGSSVMSILPDSVVNILNYLLPALFGAIFAQYAVKNPKLGAIAFALAAVSNLASKTPVVQAIKGASTIVVFVVPIFGTMLIAKLLESKKAN